MEDKQNFKENVSGGEKNDLNGNTGRILMFWLKTHHHEIFDRFFDLPDLSLVVLHDNQQDSSIKI
jgi:hypothetical protein